MPSTAKTCPKSPGPTRPRWCSSLCRGRLLTLVSTVAAVSHGLTGVGWAEDTLPAQPAPSLADRLRPPTAGILNFNDGQLGLYPVLDLEIGRKSSAGVALYAKNLLFADNQARVVVFVAPDGLFEATVFDRAEISGAFLDRVGVRFGYRHRPDGVFYGIGGETRSEDKTFFAIRAPALTVEGSRALGRLARATATLEWRQAEFSGSDFSDSTPSLLQRFGAAGQPPLPPGWSGYALIDAGLALALRSPDLDDRLAVGTGVWLLGQGGYALDPTQGALSLLHGGAEAGGAIDFSGKGHRLGMALTTRYIEALGTTPTPFTELIALGGDELLRGFLPGRLRGDSAFVTTFFYGRPIGRHVFTEIFLAAGNVFDGRLDGLNPRHFVASYGIEAEAAFSREVSLELVAGFGTSRVEPHFDPLDEFRLSLGVNHRF